MFTVPFEDLKARAKLVLDQRLARLDLASQCPDVDPRAASWVVLTYSSMPEAKRNALRTFASSSPASADDNATDQRAKAHAAAGQADWSQWLLLARHAAHRAIERWDVHRVADLIALYPECVAPFLRNASVACQLDDDGQAWIVVFHSDQLPH